MDLFIIMRNYTEAGNIERLYDEASDLFEGNNTFDYEEISAMFLGRNIGKMLRHSEDLKLKIVSIINREVLNDKNKGLIQIVTTSESYPQYSYNQVGDIIRAFYNGLCEH